MATDKITYRLEFTEAARGHLGLLSARDRIIVVEAIEQNLVHQPGVSTRNRKRVRESPLADWELRVGKYRVFYNIQEDSVVVVIVAVGEKDHNRLFIDGMEFTL